MTATRQSLAWACASALPLLCCSGETSKDLAGPSAPLPDARDDGDVFDAATEPSTAESAVDDASTPDQDAPDTWPPAAPDPPTGDPIPGLTFLVDWTDPRLIPPPVSTPGWEDSPFISADGTRLYFAYTRYDWQRLSEEHEAVVTGPDRPGQHGSSFDIYEATFSDGVWQAQNSSANTAEDVHEAAQGVSRDQSILAFVRFDPEGDIYLSRKAHGVWGTPAKLPSPINTKCVEDNVHVSPDGATLLFDSTRADDMGTSCEEETASLRRHFYRTVWDGTTWSNPTLLPGVIGESTSRWQIFETDDRSAVYWTGAETDCPGVACIYRARVDPSGETRDREIVVAPPPLAEVKANDAFMLGEISITADGRYFYFVFARWDDERRVDLSLGVARRQE